MTKIPVVQKVNQLLGSAILLGVSDIHFEPFEAVFRVRYRIDGILSNIEDLPYAQKDELISRIKIMADLDIAEKRRPQDGKITYHAHGQSSVAFQSYIKMSCVGLETYTTTLVSY